MERGGAQAGGVDAGGVGGAAAVLEYVETRGNRQRWSEAGGTGKRDMTCGPPQFSLTPVDLTLRF